MAGQAPRPAVEVSTAEYEQAHGHPPRGRGTWYFVTGHPEVPCQYGEAHDAHLRVNGECPWCAAGRLSFPATAYSAARRAMNGAGPGPWRVEP